MNDAQAARELVAAARELTAGDRGEDFLDESEDGTKRVRTKDFMKSLVKAVARAVRREFGSDAWVFGPKMTNWPTITVEFEDDSDANLVMGMPGSRSFIMGQNYAGVEDDWAKTENAEYRYDWPVSKMADEFVKWVSKQKTKRI